MLHHAVSGDVGGTVPHSVDYSTYAVLSDNYYLGVLNRFVNRFLKKNLKYLYETFGII